MILYHFLVLPNHKAKKGKTGWNYRERAEKKLKKCRKKLKKIIIVCYQHFFTPHAHQQKVSFHSAAFTSEER